MIVLGIIALLLAITIPAIQRVRETAAQTLCRSNLRQIGLALHQFHQDFGCLPPRQARPPRAQDPNVILSWMVHVLPYLEQEPLFQQSLAAARTDVNPLNDPPHLGLATVIRLYACPTDERLSRPMTDQDGVTAAFTGYVGIAGTLPPETPHGLSGVMEGGCRFSDISDGLSNTIAAAERPPPNSLRAGWWYSGYHGHGDRGPNNVLFLGANSIGDQSCMVDPRCFFPGRLEQPCDRMHLWSLHPGGGNFLFADNAVRFLRYAREPIVMELGSRAGGEPLRDLDP